MDFNLKLNEDDVNKILQALSNAPYSQVFQLLPKIQQQCQAQAAPQPAAPSTEI
jgi:hypothetical protein